MCKYANKIGFQYMWVDKYCINQSDENDKLKEIPNMRKYYMEAQSVIVWLHDIEDINDDMNKSEWLQRLWTLQEWELSKDKWILTGNGKYIKYQQKLDLSKELSIPETRLDTTDKTFYNWVNLTNKLKCTYNNDKILGFLGMLQYSKYINLEGANSIDEILYRIFIVSDCFNDSIYFSFILGIKSYMNEDFIIKMKELKFLIINIIESSNCIYENLSFINYKGLNIFIIEMLLEKDKIKGINKIDGIDYEFTRNKDKVSKFLTNNKIIYIINDAIKNKNIYVYKYSNKSLNFYNDKKANITILFFVYEPIENIIQNENESLYLSIKYSNSMASEINLRNYRSCREYLGLIIKPMDNTLFDVIGFVFLFVDNIPIGYSANLKNELLLFLGIEFRGHINLKNNLL